jgi:calcium-dependent protein kinase
MGCSIKTPYKRISIKHVSSSPIKFQPGNFIVENENSFQSVYRMGKLLGTGTFGEVRICFHRDNNTKRAVKIIRKDLLTSPHHRSCLENEIKVLKLLDHPNIIRVHEFFEESKRLFIVMEYCKGGELFGEIVKAGKFSETKAAEIMRQIFMSLRYMQHRGVVHRDLKPENILLEEKHDVMGIKLIDFGAALVISEAHTKIRGNAGTLYYMSPEILSGSYSALCDMWSAGVILYILLTGRPPFDGKDNQEIEAAIKRGTFDLETHPWPLVSQPAKELICRLLCAETSRIGPNAALESVWLSENAHSNIAIEKDLTLVLGNLKNFRSYSILRDAIKTFIATQCIDAVDVKHFKQVFQELDKNHDGKISFEELLTEYCKIMEEGEARELVGRIMEEVDSDKNGFIDYSEFLRANLDGKKILSKENLMAAFRLFDQDGNGKISPAEMKRILEGDSQLDSDVWEKIVSEFDVNGDGEIDIEEFGALLQTYTLNT